MNQILLFLLHRFSPEPAHRLGMWFMRLYQRLFVRTLRLKPRRTATLALIGSAPQIRFPSRLGLAAGFDKNAESFAALSSFGFGFIEVGTVTPLPQVGNPKPRIWRVPPQSLVNCLGFNNCGVTAFRNHLLANRRFADCPIFANIGKGRDTPNENALQDYRHNLGLLKDCVDGFVINVSSPNTKGLRDLQSVAFLESLEAILPEGKPVFIKLAPDLDDESLGDLVDAVGQSRRFTGVVLTNTSIALTSRYPGLKGGTSGPPLLERSLQAVSIARARLGSKKMIIGVGGVSDVGGYQEMREAGADLVEIYTAFVYQGPRLVRAINQVATR
jgi:dihydroorotate dehydrogenase